MIRRPPRSTPLSLHDALPISFALRSWMNATIVASCSSVGANAGMPLSSRPFRTTGPILRSEEHTSELQSLRHLVCRLLLEKKKKKKHHNLPYNEINLRQRTYS